MPELAYEDVANAAIKIQSVYRGFQARKQSETKVGRSRQLTKMEIMTERKAIKTDEPRKIGRGSGFTGNLVVDERDSRKGKRSSFLVSEAPLEEKPSQELLRHPGKINLCS